MEPSVIAARLLLAAVFAIAGAAKLRDRDGLQGTLLDFGLPDGPLVRAGSWTLPVIELAVAALLVPAATARVGALGGLALLAAFSAAVARRLARGERPDCNCFGAARSAPIGWTTLIRNGALAATAVLVAARSAPGLRWLELAAVGGAALVAAQAWLWFELLRRYGRALRRIDELESGSETLAPPAIGDEAPPFALLDLDGERVTLASLLAPERSLLLVFIDSGCGACTALLPALARWQREEAGRLSIAVVGSGDSEALRAAVAEHGLDRLIFAEDGSLARAYGVAGTPAALLVDPLARVASAVRYGQKGIEGLIDETRPHPALQQVVDV